MIHNAMVQWPEAELNLLRHHSYRVIALGRVFRDRNTFKHYIPPQIE